MTLLSELLTVALLLPAPLPQDVPEDEAAGPDILYPMAETIDPPEEGVDPRELLDRAVELMGGDVLDRMTTLSFERESYHWRGELLAFYERYSTRARFEGGLVGRVDVPSEINPDTGRPQATVFVENGDDRFMMMNRVVMAQEFHEEMASMNVRGEAFLLLAPWFLSRERAELTYDGMATLETWRPTSAAEDDASGGRRPAPGNYEPFNARYHRITATNPAPFVVAAGAVTELWIDPDTGRVAFYRLQVRNRDCYGQTPMLVEVVETREQDGVNLPVFLRTSARNDAWVREEIVISKLLLNPGLDEAILRRP